MKEKKMKIKINPILMFIILICFTILLSGILSFLGVQSEYSTINTGTNELVNNVVQVENLFSGHGLKVIATSAVSNFVNFAPLSMIIIVLIGIGVLEKTGFLKTFFTLITRNIKKYTLTFLLILFSVLSSFVGDIGYVVLLPLGALLFKIGHRNPLGGIIASFAGVSFGYGINIFMSATDSTLMSMTLNVSHLIDPKYSFGTFFGIFIMIVSAILISIAFTSVTEKYIMPLLGKYDFEEEENEEEKVKITNRELRGLIISLMVAIIYIFIIGYMIIPGLPFSGVLLDRAGELYVDKLFGPNAIFGQAFVFIIVFLFIITGFVYGFISKSIKIKDIPECLSHSLDDIGSILVLIFMASIFVSTIKKSNIGIVICALLTRLLGNFNLTGLWLIIGLFIVSFISHLFHSGFAMKWAIMSGLTIPMFMNASLSPEFTQIIYMMGASLANGLTPVMAYFVIYLSFMQKYKKDGTITMFGCLKYSSYYAIAGMVVLFILIICFYILGIPLGIGTTPGVNYVS